MIQFYARPEHIQGDRLELHDDEAHHASKVLRLKTGDLFWSTDGIGNRYNVEAISVDRKQVIGKIISHESSSTSKPHVVLVISPTKQRARMETAIEKAVELGADEIVLLQTERTERSKIRMDRLRTIVTTAMKQSLRTTLPLIKQVDDLDELLEQESDSLIWLAHEAIATSQKPGLNGRHQEQLAKAKRMLLMVGPEGGFTDQEVENVLKHGAQLISLGPNRLRAETAAMAFLSLLIPYK